MNRSACTCGYRFARCVIFGVFLVAVLQMMGCTTVRYAGAPTPSYDVDDDLFQLAEQFGPKKAVKEYYNIQKPTPEDRNKFITGRLVMINLQYLKWLRTVNADKQAIDTGADILSMSLSLAATVTGGETPKSILSAVSAAVTGAKTSIDKNYFYEKTVSALCSAMNAQRKVVLTRILDGMNKGLDDYPFEQAIVDVDEYYQAGTFMGAVTAIQVDFGAKEKEAQEEIQQITKLTPEERNAVVRVKEVLSNLKSQSLSDSDRTKLRAALTSLGVSQNKMQTDKDIRLALLRVLQGGDPDYPRKTPAEIDAALKKAGL